MDWDQSLRPGFTLVRWVRYLRDEGLFPALSANAIDDLFQAYDRGAIEYSRLTHEAPQQYGLGLHAQSSAAIRSAASDFVDRDQRGLSELALPLLALLANRTVQPLVISGAPSEVLEAYSLVLPIHRSWGVTASANRGLFTGALDSNPATAETKEMIVAGLAKRAEVVLAIGDSVSDLPLLRPARIRIVVDNSDLMAGDPDVIRVSLGQSMDAREVERVLRVLDEMMPWTS